MSENTRDIKLYLLSYFFFLVSLFFVRNLSEPTPLKCGGFDHTYDLDSFCLLVSRTISITAAY